MSRSILTPRYGSFCCSGAYSGAVAGGSATRPISSSFAAISGGIALSWAPAEATARVIVARTAKADFGDIIHQAPVILFYWAAVPVRLMMADPAQNLY